MPNTISAIERYLNRVASTTAILITLAPPLAVFALEYKQLEGQLDVAARSKAAIVDAYIGRNPGSWQFQHERLQEVLGIALLPHTDIRLVNANGKILAEVIAHNLDYSLKRTAPIHDFGLQVGLIEVADDLRPVALLSFKALIASVICALAILWVLKFYPIRALHEAHRLRHEELEKRLATETQLRFLQQRMTASQRLEAVGRLAAGVAHEVRNPLAMIQIGIDVLQNDRISPDVHANVIHEVKEAIDRANSITQNLLELSSQREPCLSVTNLNDIVQKAIALTHHEAHQNAVTLLTQMAPAALPVEVDREQMLQVTVNLLTNAIQAAGNGGNVQIETRFKMLADDDLKLDVACGMKAGDAAAVLSVIDNGKGLDDKPGNSFFEPFYTTKVVGKGTGLGLAIVQNIVALHQGSVTLANHHGGGAAATVMLRLEGDFHGA